MNLTTLASTSTTAERHAVERSTATVRVRPVRSASDLEGAVAVRRAAYGRHDGAWSRLLESTDPDDASPHARVLIAQGAHATAGADVIGTIRLHDNRDAPLPVESAATLPPALQGVRLIEATRLAVSSPHSALGRAARDALFKACWLHAIEIGAAWIVATACGPVERVYESLLFEDVFEPGHRVRLPYCIDRPYRVMALQLEHAAAMWIERRHPLLDFMFEVRPGEIELGRAPERLATALE